MREVGMIVRDALASPFRGGNLAVMAMRAIGLLYHRNKARLGWERM